jgi:hypothetical protein
MSIIFLIIITVLSVVAALFCVIGYADGKSSKWGAIISCGVLAVFVTWLVSSSYRGSRIETQEILPVSTVQSPNGSMHVVIYQDNHENKMLNFNSQFGCQASEDTKVRRTRFQTGPYCGIYFERQMGLKDRWEIIK